MPDTVADMQIVAGDVDLNMILEERARELVERVIDVDLTRAKLLLREGYITVMLKIIFSLITLFDQYHKQIDRTVGGYPQNPGYPQ